MNTIPFMDNFTINIDNVTSIGIAGNSESGKSYLLTYMLHILNNISDLIIIDSKFDLPSRWAQDNNVRVMAPNKNRSKGDFVSAVNNELSKCLDLILQRQQILYDNLNTKFEHFTVVIDKVLALYDGVSRPIKESFFSLLSQISLLRRASNIHLLLVSQRFDNNEIPIYVREQMNVLVQVGNINTKTIFISRSKFRWYCDTSRNWYWTNTSY